jgi:WD40-like Beta Propeller Repeat
MVRGISRYAALVLALALSASLAGACGRSSKGFDDGTSSGGAGADGSANFDGSTFGGEGGSSSGDGTAPRPPGCNDPKCACTLAGGAWDGTKCTLVENPGNVDPGAQGALGGGGTGDAAFKFLYPYDATVFPRGLLPPTLQMAGGAPDAMLVHIHAAAIDYKGYFGASSPGRAAPSPKAWLAITLAAGAKEPLAVDVTKKSGAAITGPVAETWTIAQGSLRGIIYYETYGSQILGGPASVGIMKIAPGATTPVPIASGCGNVCHTASADGSTLVSANGFAGISSISYSLKGTPTPLKAQPDQAFVYGGLYPDGTVTISATNYRTWFGGASKLYDTKTGTQLPAPGWDGVITNAAMPAFSPDGKQIVFNHEDTGGGHTLATMQYTKAPRSFSGLVDVANDPARFLGWPAFTPDGAVVVYHAGSSELFETDADGDSGVPASGDLFAVDLASKKTARLDQLDGYGAGGTYLPAADPALNFAPTLLPEAVGGYFWIVFTSHRSYGNTLPSKDNGDTNGKLWVAALDVGAPAGVDGSHPAFYLDGQESNADNLRGFWVLEPCESDGDQCTAGDQCCGGFCVQGPSGPVCAESSKGCANEYDKCVSSSDCCKPLECINGKCATPPPR